MPTDWPRVPLGEVCGLERRQAPPDAPAAAGLRYVGLEHVEPHTGRVLPPTDRPVIGTAFAFDARHVLYGKLRPYLNKVALPDFAGRCSTELMPLLPSDRLDRRFLGWFLGRPWVADAATAGATGSRMPRAVIANLLATPLPPVAGRRRVAAGLDAVTGRVSDLLAYRFPIPPHRACSSRSVTWSPLCDATKSSRPPTSPT